MHQPAGKIMPKGRVLDWEATLVYPSSLQVICGTVRELSGVRMRVNDKKSVPRTSGETNIPIVMLFLLWCLLNLLHACFKSRVQLYNC